ncbi:hypothetical protein COW36_18100 [bacterium (Candidatus Blackallbacteria) CG17_big_fil_post_rev_8_21_14_2_50_48_46]|uniref:Uncharacterized protein n=1 Tax=bacterium (Candidatus Blackallbacteria) CG17_big_fil_post_rev_8_21_14_2_50_48_46 TaxID=2014261 RepID=A0A2M7G0T1_9BACT|nr:MAG: hypothetical protein COW64_00625 [bacterium (Candidatus Blackallbacteria) CG18_big_fil_WC_8_21_14_2_50_49_26]PIW15328.1 MAG: hypothetical protein COW36_18100 [bacterium (Candidatus Blackallbacteria) CG17_big_fil_post_rev_8_21_14_2_50_48_46]PIW45161.1 MAG: hypothetical protein COW20_20915 [bacterium (Candidatus Blackallbacteria) CG13_big_fil_rev_8_21_14_2_50_49_14]
MSSIENNHSRWWEGGTLHDKTIHDWLNASEQNRLATTVDIVFALKEDLGAPIEFSSGEDLMAYVMQLMACITGATQEYPDTHMLKIADVALASAQSLGFLPVSEDSPPVLQ